MPPKKKKAPAPAAPTPAPPIFGQWVTLPDDLGSEDYSLGDWQPLPPGPLISAVDRFFFASDIDPATHLVAVLQGPEEVGVFMRSRAWNAAPETRSTWLWKRGGTMLCPAHPDTGDHDFSEIHTGDYLEKPRHPAARRGVKGWLECPRQGCKGWVEYDFGDGLPEAIVEALKAVEGWRPPVNPAQLTLPLGVGTVGT